jgi:hypothetical protein
VISRRLRPAGAAGERASIEATIRSGRDKRVGSIHESDPRLNFEV